VFAAVLLVAVGGVSGAKEGADDATGFPTSESTEPLAELLLGRWRADVIVQDFSPVLRESLEAVEGAADGAAAGDYEPTLGDHIAGAWQSVVGTSKTVLRSAVKRFWPDEHGFHLELSRGLHDGVLVGKVSMQDGGHNLLRDVLLGGGEGATALPPSLALDDAVRSAEDAPVPFVASMPVTVECATMTSCRAYLGVGPRSVSPTANATGSASLNDDSDADAAEALGEIRMSLPMRSRKASHRMRSGRWEWTPAKGAAVPVVNGAGVDSVPLPVLRGGLTITTNKHGLASIGSEDRTVATEDGAPLMRQHRLLLRRETDDLNREEPDMPSTIAWLSGSWWHVVIYAVLLGFVLFGKFGTRWYFRRFRGIDIDPWIKTLRTGRRDPKKKKKMMTEEEIRRLMAADDAADRSRQRRTGKKD